MGYSWRSGFHPPKGVDAADAYAAIAELGDEITADRLLMASKRMDHVLHSAIWSEGDQAWALRGRTEYCRKLIASVMVDVQSGQKCIEHIRAVEFVRGGFKSIDVILDSPDLTKELIGEVATQLGYLQAKLIKIQNNA